MNQPGPADPELIERLRMAINVEHAQQAKASADLGLIPLQLNCANTSCSNGRHHLNHVKSPRPIRNKWNAPAGQCCNCSSQVVDMAHLAELRRDHSPAGALSAGFATIEAQQHELMRAHYWRVPFDLYAWNQAHRKGRRALLEAARAKVVNDLTVIDNFSTRRAPYHGNVIGYAQHATATCCRECAAVWHGVPTADEGTPTREQLERIAVSTLLYLEARLPNLQDDPTHIPGIPKGADILDPELVASMDERLSARLAAGQDPAGLTCAKNSLINVVPMTRSRTTQVAFEYTPTLDGLASA